MIPVSEAAAILGVDARQVRRLAQDGKISGRQTSAGWLLDVDSVREMAGRRAPAGRPLSPERAWMIIRVLDRLSNAHQMGESGPGELVDGTLKDLPIDPVTRHRLRQRLAELPEDRVVINWLAHRADSRRYRVHPGVVDEFAADSRVAVGGARALSTVAGIAEGNEPITLYVGAEDQRALVSEYRAKPDPKGNVKLSVISRRVPVELRPEPTCPVPAAVAYVDALESDDARARDAASTWLRSLRSKLAGARKDSDR